MHAFNPFFLRAIVFCCAFFSVTTFFAQNGCPGCIVAVPDSLPADTLWLPSVPDGEKGKPYSEDISFRIPKTTTPVYAIDSTTPPGLPISKIEILGVDNMPPGLFWQANQMVFDPSQQTDGCIRICGTPTVSDSFVMLVRLKATVFILSQETSFNLRMYVAPQAITNDGFSMINYVGCGPTEVAFQNNVPSNGNAGFSYLWDFGNGETFTGENPPPMLYANPGVYPVNYKAVIDTSPYILQSVIIKTVGCTDPPLFGGPDLYVRILDPSGAIIYNSSPSINNTPLPYAFNPMLVLGAGNYSLEVWDEDGGIKGTDDPCGSVPFNILSNGDLSAGSLSVTLLIEKPVSEVLSSDTVVVYAQPAPPVVNAPSGYAVCANSNQSIVLTSSYGFGNQWLLNGALLAGANDFVVIAPQSGYYQAQVITPEGCVAISDSVWVSYIAPPSPPAFVNQNNLLSVADTLLLPSPYSLQWYYNNQPIPDATNVTYCATQTGPYSLRVRDDSTGCENTFSMGVIFNPAFDCTVSAHVPEGAAAWRVWPNPVGSGMAYISAPHAYGAYSVRCFGADGRLVAEQTLEATAGQLRFPCASLAAGFYWLQIGNARERLTLPLQVQY
ncbi:MAG: PKD domain-containing protein [Saprospiraceae bacterium]